MPYAFVQDVPASWHLYERVSGALIEPAPPGLILHVAGPTEEGFRVIAVWENEEAWDDFRTEQIAPAIAALNLAARPEPTFRELRARHVVAGPHISTGSLEEEEMS